MKKNITQAKIDEQKRLVKIFVIFQLGIELLDDEINNTSSVVLEYKERLNSLNEYIIPIVDKFFLKSDINKTDYFNKFPQKLDYIINREYDNHIKKYYNIVK